MADDIYLPMVSSDIEFDIQGDINIEIQDNDIAFEISGAVISGGVENFIELGDVPASYSGQGSKLVTVKADASGLEFTSPAANLTVADTASVDLTYAAGQLTATVLPAGVDHGGLSGLTDDDHTQYERHPNGVEDGSKYTIGYDPATRKFSLTIEAGGGAYWSNGTKYTLSAGAVTTPVAHANTTGTYWLYYTGATLAVAVGAPDLLTVCPLVYVVYFSDGTPRAVLFDERHPATWDPYLWRHFHLTRGAQLISGGTLGNYTLDDSVDANKRFSIESTIIEDESYRHTLSALSSGGPYSVWYRTGLDTALSWNWNTAGNDPYLHGVDEPIYNLLSGGTWSTPEFPTNNRWVNYWVCATNAHQAANPEHRFIIITGQTLHTSAANAAAESFLTGISWGTLPFAEIVPLAKVTFRRVVSGGNFNAQIDFVTVIIGTNVTATIAVSPTSHSALSGRSDAGSHPASAISTDDTNFNGVLSATQDEVQKALDRLDDIVFAKDGSVEMTGYLGLYTGTSGTPAEGDTRYNPTDHIPEFYDGSAWQSADCPVLVDTGVSSAISEGSAFTVSTGHIKLLIKWIHIITSSTSWDLTLYTKADGTKPFQIVNDRSGNYSIYLDYPYADESGTTNIYGLFTDNSGTNTCTIRILGMKMR